MGGGCEQESVDDLKSAQTSGISFTIIDAASPPLHMRPLFPLPRPSLQRLAMRVVPVPVRQDNYAYLIIDQPSNKAAAVDPYDVSKVEAVASGLGVTIIAAITTHHHHDHSGGNEVCLQLLAASHHLTLPGD